MSQDVELHRILLTMDIPVNRLELEPEDKRWLLRNLGLRNVNHPQFLRALELLT